MDSMLVLPKKIPNYLEELEEEYPDVYEFVLENSDLGNWVTPQIIDPYYDLIWMLREGFARVIVTSDEEDWWIELELWSFIDEKHLPFWMLRTIDIISLDSLLQVAMDVN